MDWYIWVCGVLAPFFISMILVFCLGRLMMVTGDVTWIVLYLVYGADGVLTVCHRVMLHENLGQPHRKHAFQLMANELKPPARPLIPVMVPINPLGNKSLATENRLADHD